MGKDSQSRFCMGYDGSLDFSKLFLREIQGEIPSPVSQTQAAYPLRSTLWRHASLPIEGAPHDAVKRFRTDPCRPPRDLL